jgi:hypothetical protein
MSSVSLVPALTTYTNYYTVSEQKHSQLAENADDELVKRRVDLTNSYQALPAYGSGLFWRVLHL